MTDVELHTHTQWHAVLLKQAPRACGTRPAQQEACGLLLLCRATINRYGFNSAGADAAAGHLDSFWVQAERHPDIKPGEQHSWVELSAGRQA